MGLLVDGQWRDGWLQTKSTGGRFKRQAQAFRHWITPDGSAGPSGDAGFKAEAGRYHLFVSFACPWAHRALIVRALKGIDELLPLSVVHWHMADNGWTFEPGDGVVADPVIGADYLYQLYQKADPKFNGRVTVPVLWDRHTDTIVNNESADIVRILNTAFDALGARPLDLYPDDLRDEIDRINDRVYSDVNNGVYKSGFATTQKAYEESVYPLFDTLDWLEERLTDRRYLAGSRFTEADIRLFTTLVRFDAVYVSHFKTNIRRLVDYPNLSGHTREIFKMPGVADTVHFDHIKQHYFVSHAAINPTGIVPAGPVLDFDTAHGRDHLAAEPLNLA